MSLTLHSCHIDIQSISSLTYNLRVLPTHHISFRHPHPLLGCMTTLQPSHSYVYTSMIFPFCDSLLSLVGLWSLYLGKGKVPL